MMGSRPSAKTSTNKKAEGTRSAAEHKRLALADGNAENEPDAPMQLAVVRRAPFVPHVSAPTMLSNLPAAPPQTVHNLSTISSPFTNMSTPPQFPLHVGKLRERLLRVDPQTNTVKQVSLATYNRQFEKTQNKPGTSSQDWGRVEYPCMGGGRPVPENVAFLQLVLRVQILKRLTGVCEGNLT